MKPPHLTDKQWRMELLDKLEIEAKIKDGAENMLQVLDKKEKSKTADSAREGMRSRVESELNASVARIALLNEQLREVPVGHDVPIRGLHQQSHIHNNMNGAGGHNHPDNGNDDTNNESPSWLISNIVQALDDPAVNADDLVTKCNELVRVFTRYPLQKYDLVLSHVGDRIQRLLLHKRTEVVAAGYRVARHALTDIYSLKTARGFQTDLFVIRSLARDNRCHFERLQALKFVRAFTDVPQGVSEISIGVVRAIVAVAEQADDRLRVAALETLAELLVLDSHLVHRAGGVRSLLALCVEGPFELAALATRVLLYTLDSPTTRHVLQGGKDLEFLVSVLTEVQQKGHVNAETLRNSCMVIGVVLSSWAGLMSSEGSSLVRALIQCLALPLPLLKDIVLSLLFDLFRLEAPFWSHSFVAGKKLTSHGRIEPKANNWRRPRYINHFLALLLTVFFKEGLLKELQHVITTKEDETSTRKALLLVSELHKLAGEVLPRELLNEIERLETLVISAQIQSSSGPNAAAANAICAIHRIDAISRNQHKTAALNSSTTVKVQMGVQIDDAHFRQLITDTRVLQTKNYTKWNWNVLMELIEGPLLNPKRLEEVTIKHFSKFAKRLMSFYRPFKYRFSAIKKTKYNRKYVETGCALLKTLLATQEGVDYLTENKLLRQMGECLAQLDPMSGIISLEPLFSAQRLESTLSYGYFELLGTLSQDKNGLAMMERWRMFNMLYHLTDVHERQDLIILIIGSLDYTIPNHTRIILSKALTTGPSPVRLFATKRLGSLLHVGGYTQPQTSPHWAISLLVGQLYDPDVEVCKLAVQLLQEYCSVTENVPHVVRCRPALDHLGAVGAPLLLRFLCTSSGFQYLQKMDFVALEMDSWFHGQNEAYVGRIEYYLEQCMVPSFGTVLDLQQDRDSKDDALASPPPHFYGELAMTEEGCQLLQKRGHFTEFADFIREHGLTAQDRDTVLKLKGCLWAVGHVGATELGAPFLDQSGVAVDVANIAKHSPVWSLKGTAFYVLGLMGTTNLGSEIIDECGWNSTLDVYGNPRGYALPYEWDGLFTERSAVVRTSQTVPPIPELPKISSDPIRRKIMTALSNLSNHILANDASRTLIKLDAKYHDRFDSLTLFLEVMELLEIYRYRLPQRRFIFELFNTPKMLERNARRQRERKRRSQRD